ncbi:MAG: BACON domain-containing protein [Prevotella sp.]|nr:BACON domain-containing protein [Prevotella sp.]
MNRIINITALFAVLVLLAGCGEDDATYSPIPTLDITASDVLFEPLGGSGSITTNSTGTLQAETDSRWVALQVQGNRVAVDVTQNPSLSGRSAKILLKADGKETSIVVTQKGMIFEVVQKAFVVESNTASTVQSAVSHMLPVSAETDADWLTPVFDEVSGQLNIALTRNVTGNVRTATVVVSSGEATERVSVTQYDLAEDIYGYYSFDYLTKEGQQQSMLAILQEGEMELLFSPTNSFYIPVSVDADSHTLTVQAPAYVGRYAGNYYTYLLVGHERAGSATDESTNTMVESPATLDAVNDNGQWSLVTSVFGGSWERYNSAGEFLSAPSVNMWIFDLYTGRVATDADWDSRWAGFVLMKCCRPHLTKLSNAEGERWLSQF